MPFRMLWYLSFDPMPDLWHMSPQNATAPRQDISIQISAVLRLGD